MGERYADIRWVGQFVTEGGQSIAEYASKRFYESAASAPVTLPAIAGFTLNGSTNGTMKPALTAAKSGTARARIMHLGDSTTMGAGSNGAIYANARVKSYPSQLAALYAADGIQASVASLIGDNATNSLDALVSYDPRLVFAGISLFAEPAYNTLGGANLFNTNAAAGAIRVDFAEAFDSVDIYHFFPGAGPDGRITVSFDGGATSSGPFVSGSSDGPGLGKITVPAPSLAVRSVLIGFPAGQTYILAVLARSSAPGIDILNAGRSGALSSNLIVSTDPFSSLPMAKTVGADLFVVQIGTNDANTGAAPADYQARLQTLVSGLKASGDVLLVSPYPSKVAQIPLDRQQQFAAAVSAVGAASGVATLNLLENFGGPPPDAEMFDVLHPNAAGYAREAALIRDVIERMRVS